MKPFVVTQTFESLTPDQSERVIKGVELQIEQVKAAMAVTYKVTPLAYAILQEELELLTGTFRKLAGRMYE